MKSNPESQRHVSTRRPSVCCLASIAAALLAIGIGTTDLSAQSVASPATVGQSTDDRTIVLALPGSVIPGSVIPGSTTQQNLDLQNEASKPVGNLIRRLCPTVSADPGSGTNVEAWTVDGWANYQRLWSELAADPQDVVLRKYLGLPIGDSAGVGVVVKTSRGRSAPRWLGWKTGSYLQVETPHLQIFSRAKESDAREVAADMERVFWVWTQLFFPLWDANPQVALHLDGIGDDESITASIQSKRSRLTSRRKLRIVLFKDAADYVRSLAQSVPGVEQSTGFYSDERQTSFFYPAETDDAIATRRHEMVHQLFREATRSGLTGQSPGRSADFWLVEGIAGYFESLQFGGGAATIGGWDSPRLQFARYRMLGARDLIPLSELRADGQVQAQRRADLARWYANAIAYTHLFFDGESVSNRRWIYQLLADLYQVRLDVPDAIEPEAPQRALVEFLRVDDQTLINNPTPRRWTQLCLAGCEVSSDGLGALDGNHHCSWLDLSRLPVSTKDVVDLCPQPGELGQLSLEATRVDDSIQSWLSNAGRLSELDLSWTSCGDATVAAMAGSGNLQTLWLTGSKVTDASIPILRQLPKLNSLDVQRTAITPAGLAAFRKARPDCNVNPLELRVQ